jgi:hypothetical protein
LFEQSGLCVCFVVKERLTFGDDTILSLFTVPIDMAAFQTQNHSSSGAMDNDNDLVSIAVGKKILKLENNESRVSITGWMDLISDKTGK